VSKHLPPEFPPGSLGLLNDVLPHDLKVNMNPGEAHAMQGDGARKVRLDLYASILAHHCSSTTPLVLILEDWEFADSVRRAHSEREASAKRARISV
jgi:hypothetical protein